jgi:hypothetical protein
VFGRHGQQERIAAQRFALDLAQIAFERHDRSVELPRLERARSSLVCASCQMI